jgi:di/tricarboxylate transporter
LTIHVVSLVGLVAIFLVGTLRPINLGIIALALTFLIGSTLAGEDVRQLVAGFPVDLLILLVGVTYLFGVALNNGTVDLIVHGAMRLFQDRRALIPWVFFIVAALPAMAGALGSAGVALIAPIALPLAHRYGIDRKLMGLMVIYGAGAGNFSPLNVLGALVLQASERAGLQVSATALFLSNLAYNAILAAVAYVWFGGLRLRQETMDREVDPGGTIPEAHWRTDRIATVIALLGVATAAFGFGLNVGFLALLAGALLQLLFPKSSGEPEKKIAWGVALLVCGIVTYVAALQRFGTVAVVGNGIAGLPTPLFAALLLCAVGAVTSAFASSAGILSALLPLSAPFMLTGAVDATGMTIALALSATVVDATPFSTVGALIVANAKEKERPAVYRGLLRWGAAMVVSAPPLTWLLFVRAAS